MKSIDEIMKENEGKDLVEIIEKIQKKNSVQGQMYGKNIHILSDAHHGCRIAPQDEVWVADGIKIAAGVAELGKVTWDMVDHAHFEDASDMPWDDESIMDWEPGDDYDLNNDDELDDLINELNR